MPHMGSAPSKRLGYVCTRSAVIIPPIEWPQAIVRLGLRKSCLNSSRTPILSGGASFPAPPGVLVGERLLHGPAGVRVGRARQREPVCEEVVGGRSVGEVVRGLVWSQRRLVAVAVEEERAVPVRRHLDFPGGAVWGRAGLARHRVVRAARPGGSRRVGGRPDGQAHCRDQDQSDATHPSLPPKEYTPGLYPAALAG